MDDFTKVRKSAKSLDRKQKLAFLLAMAERLLPVYETFSRTEGFGDIAVLRAAVALGWRSLIDNVPLRDLANAASACEQQAPDTDDYGSVLASVALDAAALTSTALRFRGKPSNRLFLEGLTLMHDTLDMVAWARSIQKGGCDDDIFDFADREFDNEMRDLKILCDGSIALEEKMERLRNL